MTPLVLTFVGDDRPGLVNAIAEKVAASGGDLAREPVGGTRGQIRRRCAGRAFPRRTLAELEVSLRRARGRGACA